MLKGLNRNEKGEAQELEIKHLLETQGFTITKTQSSVKEQIIGQ